ncbi:MAG: glycosyltransferase, partial [Candidatus Zixiibacteriota bacterium]
RADWAIDIAIRSGMTLKIAAKVDKADREYFETVIKPKLRHPKVEFIGEIGEHEKGDFLGNAYALLFPIDWPEPFGLVMIEAMACGTPVIARRRGSVPEVIDHGHSGFIFETIDEAVAMVEQVAALDRRQVRRAFDARFTSRRMAEDYLEVYMAVRKRSARQVRMPYRSEA